MSDVFYLRPLGQRVTGDDVRAMASEAGGCFDMHGVSWLRSFLSEDGEQMMCWYRSPDAESARIALRELGSDVNAVWAGTILPDDSEMMSETLDLLVEVRLSSGLPAGDVRPLLQSAMPDVLLLAGVRSLDGRRLIGLFQSGAGEGSSPDVIHPAGALSVAVWPCHGVNPRG